MSKSASATKIDTVGGLVDLLTDGVEPTEERSARTIALQIASECLDVSVSEIRTGRDTPVDSDAVAKCLFVLDRLNAGAPFAYAVGKAHFRHLTLSVDERVLIPRPETEVLIDEVLSKLGSTEASELPDTGGDESSNNRNNYSASRQSNQSAVGSYCASSNLRSGIAVDIGTGSGAIALSLAMEGCFEKVIATDVSLDALAVASGNYMDLKMALQPTLKTDGAGRGDRCIGRDANARSLADVEFRHGSYFAPLSDIKASLIVSNPPYIAFSEMEELPSLVRDWEPALALYTGSDGLESYSILASGAAEHLEDGGILALEVDSRRATDVANLLIEDGNYTEVEVRLDLTGRDRFVIARRR